MQQPTVLRRVNNEVFFKLSLETDWIFSHVTEVYEVHCIGQASPASLIVIFHILEHMPQPIRILAEALFRNVSELLSANNIEGFP